MNTKIQKLKALNMDRRGQSSVGLLTGLLVSIVVVAIVALVTENVLTQTSNTSGLWTLDGLLISVVFVILLVVVIAIIAARAG